MSTSDVCNSGASYSVTNGRPGNDGWLQVGWRYYSNYTRSMGYCERRKTTAEGGQRYLTEFPVAEQTQMYSYMRGDNEENFTCKIDTEPLIETPRGWVGFGYGTNHPVQAEAHAPHVQLGRYQPSWFNFSDAGWIPINTTGWSAMAVQGVGSDAIVWGFSQPVSNGFWVNTVANH